MSTHDRQNNFTYKATIEQMDNGAMMVIRKHQQGSSSGTIVLKKVYLSFEELIKDLGDNMKFKWPNLTRNP